MPKAVTFRVVQGRIHFRCHSCKARRLYSVPPNIRQRSITCHKCGEKTRCNFNRRLTKREQQLGRVSVEFNDGKTIDVNLADISFYGVGFDIQFQDMRKMREGREIRFHCPWNQRLLGQYRYTVRSVKGQRIGVERLGAIPAFS